MDNVKNDKYYVDQIKEQIQFLSSCMQNVTLDEFTNNVMLQNAVMFSVMQIGEYAGRLTEEFRRKYDDLPWHEMRGLRNVIAHDYDGVNMSTVYTTVTVDIPQLKIRFAEYGL